MRIYQRLMVTQKSQRSISKFCFNTEMVVDRRIHRKMLNENFRQGSLVQKCNVSHVKSAIGSCIIRNEKSIAILFSL